MNNMYVNIVGCLLSDVVGESYSETEYRADFREIRNRFRAQGMAFLTKVLPRFGKAIDFALAKQVPLHVPGFKKKHGTQLPQFLWELTSKVFDLNGCELPLGNAQALRSLRQICYSFYKLELPYDESDIERVLNSFVEVDRELNYSEESMPLHYQEVASCARKIIRRILANCDPRTIRPKHGPGVVSTGEKPWEKPYFTVYNKQIAEYYSYEENFYYNYSHFTDQLDQYLGLPEVDSRPARVVLVPKDSRGPRLISCEPVENQWVQQGQMKLLVEHLEKHPMTAGHLNFTDQTFNRWYAWLGSQTGDLVTLDMKEASDRVSLTLVMDLFPLEWQHALRASRSNETILPDGRVVRMNKFAPMGSAVCFPVEALVFYALGIAAIMCARNVEFFEAQRFYYVYGDDLIVNLEYHEVISQCFPYFGLLLNEDKCCTRGFFRESCGLDAYRGTDVTPLKLRSVWEANSSRLSPKSYLSYVAYSNAFYEKGFFNTAQYIEDSISKYYPHTPYFNKEGGCIAFVRSDKCIRALNKTHKCRTRFSKRFHRYEVLGQYAHALVKRVRKTGWEELLRRESQKPDARVGLNPHGSKTEGLPYVNSMEYFAALRNDSRIEIIDETASIASGVGNPPSNTVLKRSGLYTVPHRYRLQSRWTAVP